MSHSLSPCTEILRTTAWAANCVRGENSRSLTQMALASSADVSDSPSEFCGNWSFSCRLTSAMILRLAEELQIPRAEQNRL